MKKSDVKYGIVHSLHQIFYCRKQGDLNDESFFAITCEGCISSGAGFGAQKGNKLIRALRDSYEKCHFINEDGSMNLKSCPHYQKEVMKKYGFTTRNRYQNINGNVVYPSEVFAPEGVFTGFENFTKKRTLYIREIGVGCKKMKKEDWKNLRK